jgi:peptide/nickel transport system permease protein
MLRYAVRRLLLALPSMLAVVTIVFLLAHIAPGDPVDAMLGETAAPVERERLRTALGLDQPLVQQYRHYVVGLFSGNLGLSLHTGEPVAELIARRYPATLELAGAGLTIALLIALPLGLLAASRPGSTIDALARALATTATALPNFWLGPLLILVFSIGLQWTPVSGRGGVAHLILPAITIGLGMAASLTRLLRNSLLEHATEEYVRTARAKGATAARVFVVHLLRNAALPAVTLLGLQSGALLAGAVITETVFAWPGVGRLLLGAIQRRDYPLTQGCVLTFAVSYLIVNLLTDLAHALIDPRLRSSA